MFLCCSPVNLLRQFLYSKFFFLFLFLPRLYIAHNLWVFLSSFISLFLPCQLLTVSVLSPPTLYLNVKQCFLNCKSCHFLLCTGILWWLLLFHPLDMFYSFCSKFSLTHPWSPHLCVSFHSTLLEPPLSCVSPTICVTIS